MYCTYCFRQQQSEIRKNKSKEEKKAIKEENLRIIEEYGWAKVDGHKQKIGNFRIEPPGRDKRFPLKTRNSEHTDDCHVEKVV